MPRKAMAYSDKPTSSPVFKQTFASPEAEEEDDVHEESHRKRMKNHHSHGRSQKITTVKKTYTLPTYHGWRTADRIAEQVLSGHQIFSTTSGW